MEGLGEQDLAVSGLRDAMVQQQQGSAAARRGGSGSGVEDTFATLREEAVREAAAAGDGGGSGGGGAGARLRAAARFLASHPRSLLLFVGCALLFAALARGVGRLSVLETAVGAIVAGLVGAVAERRVFGGGGARKAT
jgi:hypothetical protein